MSLIKLQGNASGTGAFTIAAPNGNTDRTLTLPDATGTFVTADASGNVGIGTSSPATKLDVQQSTTSVLAQFKNTSSAAQNGNINAVNDAGTALRMQVFGSAAGSYGMLSAGSPALYTSASELNFAADNASGVIKFATGSSVPERARIDSSGNLLVGTTNGGLGATNGVVIGPSESAWTTGTSAVVPIRIYNKGTAGARYLMEFRNSSNAVGAITHNNSSTTYSTSSDYRLKEDWQPMAGASERVLALKPVNFAWKVDGSRVDGFLAHEVQAVVPEAVTGAKDEVDADGNPQYQGIDQSKLVPLLTAALQEALAEIANLKTRLIALEAN